MSGDRPSSDDQIRVHVDDYGDSLTIHCPCGWRQSVGEWGSATISTILELADGHLVKEHQPPRPPPPFENPHGTCIWTPTMGRSEYAWVCGDECPRT